MMTLFFVPSVIAAATEDDVVAKTVIDFAPIAVFLLVLYFVWRRRFHSPAAKLEQEHRERLVQHMQKVEDQLERILKAVERDRGV
jgi:hypothetical protein